jgi:hypothetical protein
MGNPHVHRLITYVCVGLVLTGCASTQGDPEVRQARATFQTRKTYMQGIAIGAVVGGLLGAAAGGLRVSNGHLDFNPTGAIAGGIIGGVAGGTAGGLYAHRKVQERRYYQQQEGALDAAIAQAKSTRQAAAKFNRVLASRLNDLRRDDERLKGTIEDSSAVLASLNSEISRQEQVLRTRQSAGVSSAEASRLRSEVAHLYEERAELERYIDKLAPGERERTLTAR